LGGCREPPHQRRRVSRRGCLLGNCQEGCSDPQSSADEKHFHPV
jgi:hypothetical protein